MIYKITRLFCAFCLVANIANAQINEVLLTFIPEGSGSTVTARAQNTGSGLQVVNNINLVESTEYTLRISLGDANTQFVAIQDQIRFFFETSDDLFKGTFKTNDTDSNGLPVGFSTAWNTACLDENETGTFRIALRNLGSSKAAGNNITDGTGVFDLSWNITVANDPEAPSCENEEEIITDVILTFMPVDGGEPVIARAQDPDGEGVLDLEILDDIVLEAGKSYVLTIELLNTIEDEDITEEIEEEADEHMFFFQWTEGVFSDPTGNGNVDNRNDPVNYNDFDDDNLPLGLSTNWTTSVTLTEGEFRVVLKHQPGVKSATSTVEDGETDIDLTWKIRTILSNTKTLVADAIQLYISPNPTSEWLNWTVQGQSYNEFDLSIYDQLGRLVETHKATTPSINVAHLPSGVYVFQLRNNNTIWTKQFVKK